MSKVVIPLELSVQGCKKAAKALNARANPKDPEFQKKMRFFLQRLSEVGFQEADRRFVEGARDGYEHPLLRVQWDANGFRITAMGEDVYFIEFGAGDRTEESHPFAGNASVPIHDGSYSEAHGGPYFQQGFWWYAKTKYTGIEATMPMYNSVKEMRANVRRIAQEVFE